MQHYVSKEVACPFYSQEDAIRIYHIEGIYKGNRVHISFNSNEKMKRHKERDCNSVCACRECPLYQLLERKWGDDDA